MSAYNGTIPSILDLVRTQLDQWGSYFFTSPYTAMGRWVEAQAYLGQSLFLCRELGDRLGEASMLHDLGEWHEKQGQLQDALIHYREALAIRQELTA